MRFFSRPSTIVPLLILTAIPLGCTPARRKDAVAPPPTTGQRAAQAMTIEKDAVLPPATMQPSEIRAALWDINARQKRGEASLALADYNDRAQALQTLESRYLAAAAIPDSESAWTEFKTISDEQPNFYWAHAGMASIYIRWGIRDQAEQELDVASELGPDISYTHTLRGALNRRLGDHQQAVRDYVLALTGNPKDADARVGLALSQRAVDNTASFERELTRALVDVPTHYEAAEALALWFDEKQKHTEALSAWARVAQLAPANRNAHLALARLRTDSDPSGAAMAYEAAARLKPLEQMDEQSLARLYRTLGRADDETESLKRISHLAPAEPAAWRRLAEIYAARRDEEPLVNAYKKILAIDANDVSALLGLAAVAEKNTRIVEALGFLERARLAESTVAEAEIARLADACRLPTEPITASNLTRYYRNVSESLEKLYEVRRKSAPGLTGVLKVRITTDGRGKALDAEVFENTLEDPWLEAHLVYAVLGSKLPPVDAGQGRFILGFDLPPVKK